MAMLLLLFTLLPALSPMATFCMPDTLFGYTGADGNERPCILGFPFPFTGFHAGIVAQGNGFVRIGLGIVTNGQGIVIIGRSRLADGGGAAGGSRTRSNGIAAFVCGDRPLPMTTELPCALVF